MKKNLGSKKGLILISVIMFCFAHAEWIPFRNNRSKQMPKIKLMASNEFSVILNADIFGADLKQLASKQASDADHEAFVCFSISEYAYTGDIGKPKLPMITSVLDVPHQAQLNIELLNADYEEFDLFVISGDKRIIPALASIPKSTNARPKFVLDEPTYSTDAFYPNRVAAIEENEGYARGHRLATLQLFPIHYNPVTNKIRCYTNIQVKIGFSGGNVAQTKQTIVKNYSVVWEDFMKMMVVNYPEYLKDVPPLPIYYDIFYNGAFSAAAESLAYWKSKKGYVVRKWNATGWNASALDDTIENQTPLATFLAIIGDPNSSTPLPPSGTGLESGDQTDLYYAETDGTGYLPDMFNARISVLDATQANTAIQKVLRYEHADFGAAGTAWLKKAFFIAGYDPGGMTPFAMATNGYCRNLLIPHGYTVDTIVCSSGEQETRVVNAINNGTAWCVYTAHGGETEWSVGYYGNFSVGELTTQTNNLDMYPMPCGHCCLTGDYQYSTNCFGETWDRLNGKGGICYFGSVPSTYWDEDDWLQRRYFDAIYADRIPGNIYETGRFTQWGLYWINNHTYSSLKQYYFEAYHIFNDPSLDFWTDIPDSMLVTHDTIVATDSSNFTVMVMDRDGITPIAHALVCAWIPNQSPEMQVADYTDVSGSVTLDISPTTPGDTMYITVTKHNHIPYENHALVEPLGIEDNADFSSAARIVSMTICPNPSHDNLVIRYELTEGIESVISLKIYDVGGRLVKQFNNLTIQPFNQILWDGLNELGQKVPTGIYFVRFNAGDYSRTEKLILLK